MIIMTVRVDRYKIVDFLHICIYVSAYHTYLLLIQLLRRYDRFQFCVPNIHKILKLQMISDCFVPVKVLTVACR